MCVPAQGQNKKKKKKYKKKSDANIIARGYNDVTTRNNYFFNAKLLYMNMLADIELQYERDYDEILPIYFHQKTEDFSAYESELDEIIKKTSIVMHMHDNTRWKDNVYLMLGKARYLQGDYYDAVRTFQFVVTTMEADVGKKKGAVDNKARLKAQKAKEAEKRAKERQKEIDEKKKAMKDALAKLKRDKEKETASNSKNKKKDIQKKIKAKQKVIALRKKGKKPSQKLLDLAYGKEEEEETTADTADQDKKEKSAGEKQEQEDENSVTYKVDYRSERKIQKQEEAERLSELGELADTIAMTEKEVEKYDELSFWEKIKHKSSRPEALVWMAKSYMQTGDMLTAQSMLEYAEGLRKLTGKQREGIYAGQAYYYIENRRYGNALESLDNAILISKKKKKPFYQYISAQLQERLKNHSGAIEYYRMIAGGKADFRMKFYANMKMIHLMQEDGLYDSDYILELLAKLLKNGSNKEFRDHIHYKMASIHKSREEYDEAVEHLQASITNSKSNPKQKSLSFRELGEVYLIRQNYDAASIFYDSAVAVMPMDIQGFEALKFRARTIAEVANQARIIADTDSLLLLSGMSEQDLEVYLAELEKRSREEGKKKKRKGSVTSFIEDAVIVQTGSALASADWYFYNPNLRNQGYNQFRTIWGDRIHEPNWRRRNKEATFDIAEEVEDEGIQEVEASSGEFTDLVVKLDIPRSPEEIEAAHAALSDAYYEIGKLFRNNLEMNGEAKRAFESIATEYPDHKSIDRVYYYLYLIYSEEGNIAQADKYKNILLRDYPVSQYAYAINNPYVSGQGEEDYRPDPTQIEQLYASTYNMFVDGRYSEVIQQRNEAWKTYRENPLMPKFDFLEALSYGHLDSLNVLKSKLGSIIDNYPNHEMEDKAREYLAIINNKERKEGFEDTVTVVNEADTTTFVSIYSNEESNNIFGLIVLEDKNMDVRALIQLLDQYNDNNFAERKLRASNAYLDKDTPLILVKRFRENSPALEYVQALSGSMVEIFGEENSAKMNLMMINSDNFRTLFTTKKLEEYVLFFDKTYR
jgi:tetratricopeptide (TPR) repeat protein